MHSAILFAVVIAAATALPANDLSRLENFNIDEVIGNVRLMESYAECFIGRGKCTPEGKDIKEIIPGAVQNSCSDCSAHQKNMVAKYMNALQKELPKLWEELENVYDPKHARKDALKKFLQENGH